MNIEFNTKYVKEPNAVLDQAQYQDGTIALRVRDEYGEPLCMCTLSLAAQGLKPEEGNVFLRDSEENEGVLAALQSAGIVGPVIRYHTSGFIQVPEVKLLVGIGE